jgi:hypothetical protein
MVSCFYKGQVCPRFDIGGVDEQHLHSRATEGLQACPMSNFKIFFCLPSTLRASFSTSTSSCAKFTWRSVQSASFTTTRAWQRYYGTRAMTDTSIELTAPNSRKYTQPIGLFINNEWYPSSDGEKITTINPTFVSPLPILTLHDLPFSSLAVFS